MGGKSSKSSDSDISKDSKKKGVIDKVSVAEPIVAKLEIDGPVKGISTLNKIGDTVLPKISGDESQFSELEKIVEAILRSENLNFIVNEYDEFRDKLASLPKGSPNGFFLYECYRTIHEMTSGGDYSSGVKNIADRLHEMVKEQPTYIYSCLFLASLMTSFRLVMMPTASEGQVLSLREAALEVFGQDAEDYEGGRLEEVVNALTFDIGKSLNLTFSFNTFKERFNLVKDNIGSLTDGHLTAHNLKNTCAAIQTWIYQRHEDVEEEPRWNTFTSVLRKEAHAQLQNKYLNLEYCCPNSLEVPHSIKYNSFRFSTNINFSTLNFYDQLFLSRLSNVIVQYYLEETTAHTQMLKIIGDLVIAGRRVDRQVMSQYLPTFQSIVKKLALTATEADLVNDYDLIVVYAKDNRYFHASKDDLVFDCNDEGNTFEYRLYLSQSHVLEADSVKIMIKHEWKNESIQNCAYLITARPSDTLEVLSDKLKKIYIDPKADFLNSVFKALRISTKTFLGVDEHKSLGGQSSKLKLSPQTRLSDLLAQVRDADPYYKPGCKMVDLVLFLDLIATDYAKNFEPKYSENNVDLVEELPVKFELSNLINLQMELDGFKEKAATWGEEKVMNLLPNMLYVDLKNINRYIEVPKEISVKFLQKPIEDLGLEVSNSYRVNSFICKAHNGTYYTVYLMPNTKDEIRGVVNGIEKISTLEKLKMDKVIGAVFQRKQVSV